MLYYTKTVRETYSELKTSASGLAISEAKERLRIYGPNAIKITGEPLWRKLIEPFANVFMLVLFIAALISVWHKDYLDAGIIGTIMAASATIYYIQRFSTERILRSLRKHEAQAVDVLRDGKETEIDSSLLVPGDIITLTEGEKIPADARIIESRSLRVDESQLTGESLPIDKQSEPLGEGKEVYEQSNMLFQGSFVVAGTAIAIVTTTGNDTEFGQLAALTKDSATESPVQKKIDKLLTQIIAVVGAVATVAFMLALARGMELTESLKFVLALSVSAVPESLPVAISVVLVLGMRRMAAKKALIRTMRSIETIGVITTIATDKTGTLTKNQLTVQETWQFHKDTRKFIRSIAYAVNHSSHKTHDPLDTALANFAEEKGTKEPAYQPFATLPFDQSVAMSGNVWHNGSDYHLAIKGAPEHVLARCDLTENEREIASAELHKLTASGYRVVAVAHSDLSKPIEDFDDLKGRHPLEFDGYVAIADILRPEAKKSIQAALRAGVTVRMITGDHFETAYHIGKQLGMVTSRDQVFDSRRMNVMSDEQLEKIIENTRVFSRVVPEHKYRILELLKKNNITAMTGDGVNDVPALANAHVGVAMGSGAGIAKDAGDIILLNDNFKSIVDAMHEGRTIFANIRRMLFYLLSTNAGEVITMIGSLAIGLPIPLVPVQILWVNLVTDTALVIPLGLEPGEKTNMTKKPAQPNAPILSKFLISRMILVALTMAMLTISMYAFFSAQFGHEYGRTIAFSALVTMQWANAFNARSDEESIFVRIRTFNGKFVAGLSIAITLQMLVLFGPLGQFLHVSPVAINDLAVTGAIAFIVPILFVEIHKFIGRKYLNRTNR
ncbi:MAG: cation-transporting P-type ATPase [Candidatus Saccharibacteria bacterium]|nr:MAG: cation-transporting P-type ATPase [Candidatus Saccharibacteria bacterium]